MGAGEVTGSQPAGLRVSAGHRLHQRVGSQGPHRGAVHLWIPHGGRAPTRLGAQRPAHLVPQEVLQTLPGCGALAWGAGMLEALPSSVSILASKMCFLTHAFRSDALSGDTVTSGSNLQTAFISPDRVNGVRLA